jgi:mannosyltransferase OCH1-like enzyme
MNKIIVINNKLKLVYIKNKNKKIIITNKCLNPFNIIDLKEFNINVENINILKIYYDINKGTNRDKYKLDNIEYLYIHNYYCYDNINLSIPKSTSLNPIIPLNIFQTWKTKNLEGEMKKSVQKLIECNPEFNYYLYDDNDGYNFIKTHFNNDILNAYIGLIPGAYKADLLRCCLLYVKGGVYLDIKYECVNGFKFIYLMDNEYFVLDRISGKTKKQGIYNGLMICLPNNNKLLNIINNIAENVKNNIYGESSLYPTGPRLLIDEFNNTELITFKLNFNSNNHNDIIGYNKQIILKSYKKYRNELFTLEHYSNMWKNKIIYHNPFILLDPIKIVDLTTYTDTHTHNILLSSSLMTLHKIDKDKYIVLLEYTDKSYTKTGFKLKNNNITKYTISNFENNIIYNEQPFEFLEKNQSFVKNIFLDKILNQSQSQSQIKHGDECGHGQYVIYDWYPLNIYKLNNEIYKSNIITPIFFKDIEKLTFGTFGTSFKYKDLEYIIFICYKIVKNSNSGTSHKNYYHYFLLFNSDMTECKYSKPFKFNGHCIERCNSIIYDNDNDNDIDIDIDNNNFIIPFTTSNNTTKIGYYSCEYIIDLINRGQKVNF